MNLRLLESGDIRLLETGDELLLEIQPPDLDGYLLLETGDNRLLENGLFRALEGLSQPSPFFMGFGMSGKIGEEGQEDLLNVKGIYQMRMTKRGKVPIKMKFYTPTNPQTVAQQANRAKFAAGMAAWSALTPEQKLAYNKSSRKRQMFGWGYFLREYFKNN